VGLINKEDMNKKKYEAMEAACQHFVNKVDNGRARSVESYSQMRDALAMGDCSDLMTVQFKSGVSIVVERSLGICISEAVVARHIGRCDFYNEDRELLAVIDIDDILFIVSV